MPAIGDSASGAGIGNRVKDFGPHFPYQILSIDRVHMVR